MRSQITGALTLDATSLAEIIADTVVTRLHSASPTAPAPLEPEAAVDALMHDVGMTSEQAHLVFRGLYENGYVISARPAAHPSPPALDDRPKGWFQSTPD